MEEVEVIQSLSGCTLEEAKSAFETYKTIVDAVDHLLPCLLYTSPSPRD